MLCSGFPFCPFSSLGRRTASKEVLLSHLRVPAGLEGRRWALAGSSRHVRRSVVEASSESCFGQRSVHLPPSLSNLLGSSENPARRLQWCNSSPCCTAGSARDASMQVAACRCYGEDLRPEFESPGSTQPGHFLECFPSHLFLECHASFAKLPLFGGADVPSGRSGRSGNMVSVRTGSSSELRNSPPASNGLGEDSELAQVLQGTSRCVH